MYAFLILNQSIVPCLVPAVASWPANRFLKKQVGWFGIPVSLRILHSLLWSTQAKDLILWKFKILWYNNIYPMFYIWLIYLFLCMRYVPILSYKRCIQIFSHKTYIPILPYMKYITLFSYMKYIWNTTQKNSRIKTGKIWK